MRISFLKSALVSLLALAACGGGGGGGGGSTSRPTTGFRVLQGNIDAAPLDIYKAGETAPAATVRFGNASSYVATDGQDQAVTITTANTPTELVASTVIPLTKGVVKTLMIYGDNGSIGQRTALFEDPLADAPNGKAMIRIIHGAVGAAKVRARAGATEISSSTQFGGVSDYVEVAPGPVQLVVERSVDNIDIFNATQTLEGGKVYSLFVSGDMNYYAKGQLLADN